jgi:BatD DUF11 like domain
MARATTDGPWEPRTKRTERAFPGRNPLLLLLVLWALPIVGVAKESAAFQVLAWVDKTEATLEDQIFLTVSVSGERSLPSDPELPPMPDFSVTKGGTSSHTEIVNGTIRTSAEVTFLLTPRRVGTFTIGPVSVQRKGRTYQSEPLLIKILPAASPDSESPMAFVTQDVDVESPFVHQQIVYTFRFLRRVQSVEAQWDPPSFQGFWVEDLGKERQYEKVISGHRYAVTEIKKALYPVSEGPARIEETQLACQVVVQQGGSRSGRNGLFDDGIFGNPFLGSRARTITKNLRAEPISIDVRPLPEAGRPVGFNGLVGSFVVQAEVGQKELRVGDSTTLTVTVTGDGNLQDLVTLAPEEFQGFKVYPDRPSLQLDIQGDRLQGTKVFKKALVPLEDGTLEIPPQELPYFDPQTGAYRIARTEPFTLTVERSGEAEPLHVVTTAALPGSKSTIQVLGKDILPIHTGLAGARSQVPSGTTFPVYLASLLFPPLAFLVCYGRKRRQERVAIDQHIVRRKGARKKANRFLREARKQIGEAEDKEFPGHLSRTLKGLIGDKLNLSTLAYTPLEIERCLLEKGIPGEEARRVRGFLEQLEYDLYVSKRLEAGEREARYKKAKRLLAWLDKRL